MNPDVLLGPGLNGSPKRSRPTRRTRDAAATALVCANREDAGQTPTRRHRWPAREVCAGWRSSWAAYRFGEATVGPSHIQPAVRDTRALRRRAQFGARRRGFETSERISLSGRGAAPTPAVFGSNIIV
jgi:hypothetical protein